MSVNSILNSLLFFLFITFLGQSQANERTINPLTQKMDNGLIIQYLPHSELPIVAIDFVLKTGSLIEPKDKAGLASFTAQLLLRGSRNRSYNQIIKTLKSLGTKIEVKAGKSAIVFSCLVLRWDFEAAFSLLTDLILYPAFEVDEMMKLKQHFSKLPGAKLNKQFKTCSLVSLNSAGFANSNLISDNFTREDVLKYYYRNFVPQQTEIKLTGNLPTPGILSEIKKKLKHWPKTPYLRKHKKTKSMPGFQFASTEVFPLSKVLFADSEQCQH